MAGANVALPSASVEVSDDPSQDDVQVQLTVQTISGESVLQDALLPASGTLKHVKQMIHTVSAIPEQQQRLVWQDAVINDSAVLRDVLPMQGALLQLIVIDLLQDAVAAVENLDKRSIAEVTAYAKPPDMVMKTMCAVLTVMEKTPSWVQAKTELGDGMFVRKVKDFDANSLKSETRRKLQKYTRDPNFTPAAAVAGGSPAAAALCQWVHAVSACAEQNCQTVEA